MLRHRHLLLAVLIPVLMLVGVVTGGLLLPLGWKNLAAPALALLAKEDDTGTRDGVVRAAAVRPLTQPAGGDPATEPAKPGKVSDAGPGLGLDIARIDPNGTSVIAGLAKASSDVTVLADGVPIGSVQSDSNGEWVFITNHKFASPTPRITLRYGASPSVQVAAATAAPARQIVPKPAVASDGRKSVDDVTAGMLRCLQTRMPAAEQSGAAAPAAGGTDGVAGKSRVARAGVQASVPAASGSVTTEALPVPIKFVYRTAEMTPGGREAAEVLLHFLKAKAPVRVVLSGHADERGPEPVNLRLSEERLGAIEKFLRDGGYSGELVLVPKGESEQFAGIDRSQYSRAELWELDRRVELRTIE